jgi:hypothetical protein
MSNTVRNILNFERVCSSPSPQKCQMYRKDKEHVGVLNMHLKMYPLLQQIILVTYTKCKMVYKQIWTKSTSNSQYLFMMLVESINLYWPYCLSSIALFQYLHCHTKLKFCCQPHHIRGFKIPKSCTIKVNVYDSSTKTVKINLTSE